MNFNQLQYIVTVAEEKNISRAAQKLFISQPSLSQCIQNIEQEYHIKLFDRSKTPLKLTYAGEVFVDWAKNVLFSAEQLKQQMSDISKEKSFKLVIGISPYRSTYVLPPVIGELKSKYPDCHIVIEEHPTTILHELFEDRKIDILIDTPHPDTVAYTSIPLINEDILLGVPSDWHVNVIQQDVYPLINLSEFKDKPFILLSKEQLFGKLARNLCLKNGFKPVVALECHNIETAYSMVKEKNGVTFVPEMFVKYQKPDSDVKYYKIKGFEPERQFCVIYSNERYLPEAAKDFIEILRNYLLKKN